MALPLIGYGWIKRKRASKENNEINTKFKFGNKVQSLTMEQEKILKYKEKIFKLEEKIKEKVLEEREKIVNYKEKIKQQEQILKEKIKQRRILYLKLGAGATGTLVSAVAIKKMLGFGKKGNKFGSKPDQKKKKVKKYLKIGAGILAAGAASAFVLSNKGTRQFLGNQARKTGKSIKGMVVESPQQRALREENERRNKEARNWAIEHSHEQTPYLSPWASTATRQRVAKQMEQHRARNTVHNPLINS